VLLLFPSYSPFFFCVLLFIVPRRPFLHLRVFPSFYEQESFPVITYLHRFWLFALLFSSGVLGRFGTLGCIYLLFFFKLPRMYDTSYSPLLLSAWWGLGNFSLFTTCGVFTEWVGILFFFLHRFRVLCPVLSSQWRVLLQFDLSHPIFFSARPFSLFLSPPPRTGRFSHFFLSPFFAQ